MKRPLVSAIFLCALTTLVGCPIYDHEDAGCYRSSDCGPGYSCNTDNNVCYLDQPGGSNSCTKPSDCAVNSTCGKNGQCASGDCYFNGCVAGYVCGKADGAWACVVDTGGAGGAGGADSIAETAGAGGDAQLSSGGAPTIGGAGAPNAAGAAGQSN